MKKLLLTMLGVALIAAPASAQMEGMGVRVEKIDVNKLKAEIAKSDAEIANAKKAAKAATWVKRGTTFVNVDAQPVNGLYTGMPEQMLKITYGDAASNEEVISGRPYTVYTYEHVKVYIANGLVEYFIPTTVVDPAALDKAYDAFDKAYQLDAKTAKKVGEGMGSIHLKSFENGAALYFIGDTKLSAENFRRAYKASNHPTYTGGVDSLAIYYAGMVAVNGEDWTAGMNDIDKALALGYDAEGSAYRLKFVALYYLDRKDEALAVLDKGLELYPADEQLIDSKLRYLAESDGDPSSMIPVAESAIAKNPNNPGLYQGLARIYDKLGQIDKSIETIQKAVELAPDDFVSNYLEGMFIVYKGDAMNEENRKQTFTSRAQFQVAEKAVNDVYRTAIAPFEKANSLNPEEIAPVEWLKNITYRLRDEPGMNEKYQKYNDLFNSMSGQAPVEE